jgi:spore coat polysaccharide biosynthesis predicted glycosyltransferase SpsG
MGGVDKDNITSKVLNALRGLTLPEGCRIVVVLGAEALWFEKVSALSSHLPWPIEVRVGIDDMAQVMADSDLVIGAAGSSSWERCCLGLPALIVVQAKNQQLGARSLHSHGAAQLLSLNNEIQPQIEAHLSTLISHESLVNMSLSARAISDGLGAARVFKHLKCQT